MKTHDGQLTLETKGVWIPICIWDNKGLTLQEKAILVKIESFKECFASNEYLAEFADVSVSRIKQILKSLEEKGFIYRSTDRKGKVIVKRVISVDKAKFYGIDLDDSELDRGRDLGQETTPTKDRKLSQVRTGNCPDNSKANNKDNNPHTPASGGDESEKPKSGHAIKNADYTVEDVVELYNEVCGELLPRCNAINDSRIRSARKLSQLKLVNGKQPFIDGGLDAWKVYFAKAISNPFNTGNNDRAWKANFDYLMREAKALMILGI